MAQRPYVDALVDKLSQVVELPLDVKDDETPCAWIQSRGGNWARYLRENSVHVTVNRRVADHRFAVNNSQAIAFFLNGLI